MLRVPVAAAADCYISTQEKAHLLKVLEDNSLPPLITIPMFFLSPDLHHTTAFVQHVHERYVYPWMEKNFPACRRIHFKRSDGCAGQYKCGRHFRWLAMHGPAGKPSLRGIPIQHSHFESCHGKDLSDPECGRIKFLLEAREMQHGVMADLVWPLARSRPPSSRLRSGSAGHRSRSSNRS